MLQNFQARWWIMQLKEFGHFHPHLLPVCVLELVFKSRQGCWFHLLKYRDKVLTEAPGTKPPHRQDYAGPGLSPQTIFAKIICKIVHSCCSSSSFGQNANAVVYSGDIVSRFNPSVAAAKTHTTVSSLLLV